MKKIQISIVIFVILSLIADRVFAIYHYSFILNAFELNRDDTPITYSLIRNHNQGYTNQDVDVVLDFNKEIEDIEGFEKQPEGNTYKKSFAENENLDFEVTDKYGNRCTINYTIDNIDKIPPTIDNVDDGATYNTTVSPIYNDNIGISSINVEKYRDLEMRMYPDYVDSSDYKGLDLLDKSVFVRIIGNPRGAQKYNFYINNVLKYSGPNKAYTFTNLTPYTTYVLRVEAAKEDGTVLQGENRTIRTKLVSGVSCVKNDSNKSFTVRITGLDSRIATANMVKFDKAHMDNKIYTYIPIYSDRSVQATMYASDVESTFIPTVYYFHFQFWDANGKHLDTICVNVRFNEIYDPNNDDILDINNFKDRGEYDMLITDLAGNQTFKSIKIANN